MDRARNLSRPASPAEPKIFGAANRVDSNPLLSVRSAPPEHGFDPLTRHGAAGGMVRNLADDVKGFVSLDANFLSVSLSRDNECRL